MMGNDYTPYFARSGDAIELDAPMRFGPETSLIEMPISWTLDDYPHFEYVRNARYSMQGLMPAGGVLQNWLDDFDYMTRIVDWGVLTYTCHPFVIGRGHRMLMLERLIEALQGVQRGLHDDGGCRERVAQAQSEARMRSAAFSPIMTRRAWAWVSTRRLGRRIAGP